MSMKAAFKLSFMTWRLSIPDLESWSSWVIRLRYAASTISSLNFSRKAKKVCKQDLIANSSLLWSKIFWTRLHSLMIQVLKDDNVKFYEFLVERATEYDRMHWLRIEAKRECEAREVAPSESDRYFHCGRSRTSGYSSERPSKKTFGCWDCEGNHSLRDYWKISDVEKKKIYDEILEKKGSKWRFSIFLNYIDENARK